MIRWEVVELLRKLALTGFVQLSPEDNDNGRVLTALLISLVFLNAHWAIRPFKRSCLSHAPWRIVAHAWRLAAEALSSPTCAFRLAFRITAFLSTCAGAARSGF